MATGRIVVGYDGSYSGRVALAWGARAAQSRHAPLLVAHVGYPPAPAIASFVTLMDPSPEPLLEADEDLLDDAARRVRLEVPELEVGTAAVHGPVVARLLELLADAQLGVVGCRGLGTLAEKLVGSTSLKLAVHAPCPLVVVRSSYYCEPGQDAGRVVIGVDGSSNADAAVAFAFDEAQLRGCGVTAVYAWDAPVGDGYGRERQASRMLSWWLDGWSDKYPEVDVRQRLVRDTPAASLVAASAGAELVVVGAHGSGGRRSLLLGSVTHAVLHGTHSAVAVVRAAAA
jgi:nucleotide-binding universal stress UspA family protein